MPKPSVNPDICIGCGLCVGMHPDIFTLSDDGKAVACGEGTDEEVSDAVASCPVQAISE